MERVRDVTENKPKFLLACNGLVSIMVFAFVISAIASAKVADDLKENNFARAVGFTSIWNMFIVFGLNLSTYYILLKKPTTELVSGLIGATAIMCLEMIVLAVLFGGLNSVSSHAAFRAMVAFSVFLFLLYGAMAFLFARFRDDIIDESGSNQQSHPDGTFEPPSGNRAGENYAPPAPPAV